VRTIQSSFPLEKLSTLVEINIGKTPARKESSYWGGKYTWVAISDLKGSKYINSTKEGITEEGIINSKIKIVPKNTILFSYKLSIGKVAITKKPLYTNEAIASFPILDETKIDKDYLYYVLREFDFTDGGDRAVMGKTLNKAKLKKLKIPLPPLAEQQKIAAILDAADQLRQKDQQVIDHYTTLSQSLFLEMFGDPVTNPMGWEYKLLNEICSKITDGTHHSPPLTKSGVPYVTAKHVKTDGLDFFAKPTYISEDDHEDIYARCAPKYGDVLYIKDGATTGIACLNTFHEPISLLSSLALLKTHPFNMNNTFLCFWLNHNGIKEKLIHQYMSGAAIKRYTLAKINTFSVMSPPIDLQNQFAQHIEKIEQQKQLAQASLEKSETLFNSLLQRAFKGELTYSGYEAPAS